MAVWQTKEDLLVQLTSLVDDEKSEAAFQLNHFKILKAMLMLFVCFSCGCKAKQNRKQLLENNKPR